MTKFFTFLLLLVGATLQAQTTYHVKIGGDDSKDGKSWNNAFATIQKALSVSINTGDEIAIAKGTYYPDEGPGLTNNDRNHSFALKNGVDMFGGYAGVEGVYDRNLVLNPTILSGNIQQDIFFNNNTYNIVRAFSLSGTLVLDGFTITEGNADFATSGIASQGGGLKNIASNISVINCSFINNSAVREGGAVYNTHSNSTFYNCIFSGNSSPKGGGIYNTNDVGGFNSSLTIGNCNFNNNTGAAIYNYGKGGVASPTISNCKFINNSDVSIFNFGEETPLGLGNDGTASPSIFNSVFIGPAIHNVVKSIFNSNGGIASPAVYNCSFFSGTYPAVSNEGTDGVVNPTFINCIIRGQMSNINSTPSISYSIFNGPPFGDSWIDGGHNLDVDPMFVDAANGNLRLQTCSPAIDAGNTSILKVSPDLDGYSRVINSIIDMGAYETPAGTDIYPPVVKTKNISLGLNANGLASIIAINVNDGSTDNCGILSMSVSPSSFNCNNVGSNTVTLTVNDINGNSATGQATVTIVDNIVPVAICRNITVHSDANGNATITPAQIDNGSTDVCGIASLTLSKTTFNCADVGANIVTFTVTDNNGNTSTCNATVTLEDKISPVAVCRNITVELDANGNATISPIQIDNGSNDACGIKSLSLNKTTFDCTNVGTNEVTLTVTDNNNNVSSCTATVIVEDNIAPAITNISASPAILWPVNHKMIDVAIKYTITDNCPGTTCVISGITLIENGSGSGNTSPDWEIKNANLVSLRAERSAGGTGRIYVITIRCTDAVGNVTTATTEVKVVHNIKSPNSGHAVKVGSTLTFTGEFWDNPGKIHTTKWLADESFASNGIVTEPVGNQNGKVTGSYKFNNPGVYKLQMNVTDQTGVTSYANTNGDLEAIVVVFDPNGGNTYGGGYYNSPAGALKSNPTAIGKASYGFAMNYFKNSTNPKGETQFEFKVGDFEFNALNFEYLVISNSMAQFKGSGKIIGGQSGVGFTMTVVDGQLDGTGVDKIRMKIYNKNNGTIIYDNQPGASDAALPTQAVGANSIIVISGTNSMLTTANRTQSTEMEVKPEEGSNDFDVIAFPNPSTSNFTVSVKGNAKEKATMQVTDMYGRIIETGNVTANSFTQFGDRYRPGTYFVRVLQGKEHKEIKLIKITD